MVATISPYDGRIGLMRGSGLNAVWCGHSKSGTHFLFVCSGMGDGKIWARIRCDDVHDADWPYKVPSMKIIES